MDEALENSSRVLMNMNVARQSIGALLCVRTKGR